MIISPYSETAKFAAGGKWAATTQAELNANYPCIQHWFPCDESAGATTWTDRNGVVIPATVIAGAITGSMDPGNLVNVTPSVGSFYRPDVTNVATYKAFIMLVVGKGSVSSGVALGASVTTGARVALLSQTAASTISDGTNSVASNAALTVTSRMCYGVAVDFNANIRSFQHDGTTWTLHTGTAVSAATPASLATGVANVANAITVNNGMTDFCGVQIIRLTAMPSDTFLQGMAAWYNYHWLNNLKRPYPALKGVV